MSGIPDCLQGLRGKLGVALILRCRKVSVLMAENYLYSGEGLGQPNLDLLQAVVGLVRCSGLPTIICGDFQNTRVEGVG